MMAIDRCIQGVENISAYESIYHFQLKEQFPSSVRLCMVGMQYHSDLILTETYPLGQILIKCPGIFILISNLSINTI